MQSLLPSLMATPSFLVFFLSSLCLALPQEEILGKIGSYPPPHHEAALLLPFSICACSCTPRGQNFSQDQENRARRREVSCLGCGRKGRNSGFTGREHSMEKNPSPGPGVPALPSVCHCGGDSVAMALLALLALLLSCQSPPHHPVCAASFPCKSHAVPVSTAGRISEWTLTKGCGLGMSQRNP